MGETRYFINESENHRTYRYIVLPLHGRFQGESSQNFHFVAVIAKTNSGLCIYTLSQEDLDLKEKRNLIRGFCLNDKSKRLSLKDM